MPALKRLPSGLSSPLAPLVGSSQASARQLGSDPVLAETKHFSPSIEGLVVVAAGGRMSAARVCMVPALVLVKLMPTMWPHVAKHQSCRRLVVPAQS